MSVNPTSLVIVVVLLIGIFLWVRSMSSKASILFLRVGRVVIETGVEPRGIWGYDFPYRSTPRSKMWGNLYNWIAKFCKFLVVASTVAIAVSIFALLVWLIDPTTIPAVISSLFTRGGNGIFKLFFVFFVIAINIILILAKWMLPMMVDSFETAGTAIIETGVEPKGVRLFGQPYYDTPRLKIIGILFILVSKIAWFWDKIILFVAILLDLQFIMWLT